MPTPDTHSIEISHQIFFSSDTAFYLSQGIEHGAFELPLSTWLRECFAANDKDVFYSLAQGHDLGGLKIDAKVNKHLRDITE